MYKIFRLRLDALWFWIAFGSLTGCGKGTGADNGAIGGGTSTRPAASGGSNASAGATSTGGNGSPGTSSDTDAATGVDDYNGDVIVAGYYRTCMLRNGGLWCWGMNTFGELGIDTTVDSHVPVQVLGITSGVTAVAIGEQHTCAVVYGGAQCWGLNSDGQLGNDSTTASHVPVQVQGLTAGVTAIAAGTYHSCALVNGGVKCWGYNSHGQLGNNSNIVDSHTPVQVQGLTAGVTAVSAGFYHTCAVANGSVLCWGTNAYGGKLGISDPANDYVPVLIQGFTSRVTALTGGYYHSCALVDSAAKCWGSNSFGELGNNAVPTPSTSAVQVQGLTSGVSSIAAGVNVHTCALVAGQMRCWGDNDYGELGDGSTTRSPVPVQVQGLSSGVTAIAVGAYHSCAIVNDEVRCWGDNSFGELGNNSTVNSLDPVLVQFAP